MLWSFSEIFTYSALQKLLDKQFPPIRMHAIHAIFDNGLNKVNIEQVTFKLLYYCWENMK